MAVVLGNPEPYAGCCTTTSSSPASRITACRVRTLADSVLGRGCCACSRCPTTTFAATMCSRCSPALRCSTATAPSAAVAWERISHATRVCRAARPSGRRGSQHYRGGLDARPVAEGAEWAAPAARGPASWRGSSRASPIDIARAPARGRSSRSGRTPSCRWIGSDDGVRSAGRRSSRKPPVRVEPAVDRLGGLDPVEASPTLEVFRRSLALELDAARDRVGRLGEGLLVGLRRVWRSAWSSIGSWVCGLAEGVFPAPPSDDPLLADADRGALEVSSRSKRRPRRRRSTRAACRARQHHRRAARMCFPRGDLRRNTEHVPSRFLLDTVEALSGTSARFVTPGRRAVVHDGSVVRARSHSCAVPRDPSRARVRAALAGDAGSRPCPTFARVASSAARARARRSPGSTATSPISVPRSRGAEPAAPPDIAISATRLETWVQCPHAYFTRYLLHVQADRAAGGAVAAVATRPGQHRARQPRRFLTELDRRRRRGQPWSAEHRERLHEILAQSAATTIEASGLGGRRLLWARARPRAPRAARHLPRLRRRLPHRQAGRHDRDRAPVRSCRERPSSGRDQLHRRPQCAARRVDRPRRPLRRRPPLGHRLQERFELVTTRSCLRRRSAASRAGCCSSRSIRTPARTIVGPGADSPSTLVLVRAPCPEETPWLHGRRRVEQALDRRCSVIVDGIDAGHFPLRPRSPASSS